MGSKLIVLDDVLSQKNIKDMIAYYEKNPYKLYGDWYSEPLEWQMNILYEANKFFDLSNIIGFESWGHTISRPDWHIDHDELAFKNGYDENPICSIVFYPHVDLISGGEFVTKTEKIQPKTNRAIFFSPKILHTVESWQGERMSVAINPWSYIPYTYRHK